MGEFDSKSDMVPCERPEKRDVPEVGQGGFISVSHEFLRYGRIVYRSLTLQ